MAKTFREWSPEQSVMFPPTVLDLVGKDELVYFILNLVVEQLDLSMANSNLLRKFRGFFPAVL